LTLAVVGMSACLGAVVRAPVTGILIVFEMTHEFSLVPALMLGALVSQAISRRLSPHSFYEEILVQDGHRLEHVIPPRDLQSWQQLPVSAIANFQPIFAQASVPLEVQKLLRTHPYQRFPVVEQGKPLGILTRKEAEAAIAEKRSPKLEPAATCLPHQTIRELQSTLIESISLMALVLDQPNGKVLGLVTLHDLLRAEVTIAKGGAG
jgi:CIC family chloride channel protein